MIQSRSVLEPLFEDSMYDGIYSFNILHLLWNNDRGVFVQRCLEQLNVEGKIFFVGFSDKELSIETNKNRFVNDEFSKNDET